MKILVLDRSTDAQSAAYVEDGAVRAARVFAGEDSRSGDWPVKIRDFLAENGCAAHALDRIVVGQGPGSFAGIRAALGFAQGVALGGHADVVGLPSAAALSVSGVKRAVVGDARRDRFWVVCYDGEEKKGDFALVRKEGLAAAVPPGYRVVTPDGARIDALLSGIFGGAYEGSVAPTAARLAEVYLARPEDAVPEPLPVYLQPAVRED